MAKGYVSHFQLYNARIDAHFLGPTGMVAKHANAVGLNAQTRARILAPKRTGALMRSVTWGPFPQGRLRYAISLGAYVHYAPFVISGTHSPITPWNGRWLKVPTTRMGGKFMYRQYVRGQRANNFLAEAMTAALVAHGIDIVG
jgi:hypothetical protein